MAAFTESIIERSALDWLAGLGHQTLFSPDIDPDMPAAERDNYGQVDLSSDLGMTQGKSPLTDRKYSVKE
jgi:type I restriction enzyme R subunit